MLNKLCRGGMVREGQELAEACFEQSGRTHVSLMCSLLLNRARGSGHM